jgi:hypothetical protein
MVGFADFMAARTNPKVAERRPAVPVSRLADVSGFLGETAA